MTGLFIGMTIDLVISMNSNYVVNEIRLVF